MAKAARERLARLLAGEEAGAFSAQLSMPSDALQLGVDGVGQVRLPVRPAQARKLCGAARPAHFGHREETILDPAVRDTWEISPDVVRLDGPSWAPAMEGALAALADELGVPAGAGWRPSCTHCWCMDPGSSSSLTPTPRRTTR